MSTLNVRDLGDYIREQRRIAEISLRQLARQAGVSNPYLSQIERGLRKPSAEILQQIAKALRISAEALYIQAGILEERQGEGDVPEAILRDELISERQKQVLLEIYESFRRENDARLLAEAAQALAAEEGVQVDVSSPEPSVVSTPELPAATERPVRPRRTTRTTRPTKAASANGSAKHIESGKHIEDDAATG